MITIYHAPMARSLRVIWLCEELGLDYTLKTYQLFTADMQSEAFLAVHPLGKVPAIDDDGFVLWETLAIIEYLVEKYSDGALLPSRATPAGAEAVQWMEFAENQLTVYASEVIVHDGVLPEERIIPQLVGRGRQELPKMVGVAERALQGRDYILGDQFSAADIMLGFAMPIAQYAGFVDDSTPNCQAYLQRIAARDAYQRAMAVDQ